MKSGLTRNIIFSLLISLSGAAVASAADPVIQMGTPTYSGAGCKAGTASVTLSPDSQAVSVIYDSFQVEAGRAVQRRSHSKGCTIRIPLQIPAGYYLLATRADYRGFNSIPQGGYTTVKVQQGLRTPAATKYAKAQTFRFDGPMDQEYTASNQMLKSLKSNCGGKATLLLNTKLQTTTNKYKESALATVDSTDLTSQTTVQMILSPCVK